MRFIDTNVFVRYLTADDPEKASACRRLFERLSTGEELATACESVVAEVVYVLGSRATYGLAPGEIRDRLAPLLSVRGLRLPEKAAYLRALDLLVEYPSLDFEDVLLAAHMERAGEAEIYSYDADFDLVPELMRLEPS